MKTRLRWSRALRVCALGLTLAATGCAAGGAAPEAVEPTSSTAIRIAAAASLEPVLAELAAAFEREHDEYSIATPTFDGSALLATQIVAGAPFDVFLAADQHTMQQVTDAGILDAPARSFAANSLEVAVAPGNPLSITTLRDLVAPAENGELPVVVMCAEQVPCGAAARQLLDRDRVTLRAASEEQNVTAVLRRVVDGYADAGIVYRTDVLYASDAVDGVPIPDAEDAATVYQVGVLRDARDIAASRAFAGFLLSADAQALLRTHKFGAA
ncbi:molybdate ABC transporter substrate-binding protein [Leucobacter sp. W1153]|uniref:molybdate ABC transporter substrate-binding protein n=1 Tax=Leucobacter sp. W1153 TaxID=3439064 RepID=UPI003F329521